MESGTETNGPVYADGRFDGLTDGSDLRGVTFLRWRFARGRYFGVDLSGARFEDVVFGDEDGPVTLRGCDLSRSRFVRTRFCGVDVPACRFDDTAFESCDLSDVSSGLPEIRQVDSALDVHVVTLRPSFTRTVFDRCRLSSSDLGGDWKVARLWDCVMCRVSMAGSTAVGLEFRGGRLDRVSFAGADLSGAVFEDIRLDGCRFGASDIKTRTTMTGTAFGPGSVGTRVRFANCDLRTATFEGAAFTDPDIGPGVTWPRTLPSRLFGGLTPLRIANHARARGASSSTIRTLKTRLGQTAGRAAVGVFFTPVALVLAALGRLPPPERTQPVPPRDRRRMGEDG